MDFPKLSTDFARANIPAIVEPKYDGELTVWTGDRFINRFGTQSYITSICKHLPSNMKLVGELYYDDGKRNFYEALPYLKEKAECLNYVIFGLYESNLPYRKQFEEISYMFGFDDYKIHTIAGKTAYQYAEIKEYCRDYVSEGYEGAVVKPAQGGHYNWIKYKPFETLDLVVVGVSRKKSAVAVGDRSGKIYASCSTHGKEFIGEALKDKKIVGRDSEFYYIEPSVVVEVKHLGVINGQSLRSPVLVRVREDIGIEDTDILEERLGGGV